MGYTFAMATQRVSLSVPRREGVSVGTGNRASPMGETLPLSTALLTP